MTKKILNIIFAVMLIAASTQFTKAVFASDDYIVSGVVEAKHIDRKAKILASYLAAHDSPLQYHAQDFIDAANAYNLDWRLVPAISGVESTFGKFIPGGYNGWGWGVYGDQAIYFKSWTDAIFTISKGLREKYLDKGYSDPYSINTIYASSTSWGSRVSYFMQDLENYASKFPTENVQLTKASISTQIAAVSATPVNNALEPSL